MYKDRRKLTRTVIIMGVTVTATAIIYYQYDVNIVTIIPIDNLDVCIYTHFDLHQTPPHKMPVGKNV